MPVHVPVSALLLKNLSVPAVVAAPVPVVQEVAVDKIFDMILFSHMYLLPIS